MTIETLTKSQFVGDETIRASFSYEAAGALFDWYSEISEDLDKPIEFDPVAFRCEFSEYALDELQHDYGHLLEDDQEPEDLPELLSKYTLIIKLDSTQSWLVKEF